MGFHNREWKKWHILAESGRNWLILSARYRNTYTHDARKF